MESILAICTLLMISKSEVVLHNLISPRLAFFMFTIWYSKSKATTELRNLEIWEFQFHCKFEAGKPQQIFTKSLQYIAYKRGREQFGEVIFHSKAYLCCDEFIPSKHYGCMFSMEFQEEGRQ